MNGLLVSLALIVAQVAAEPADVAQRSSSDAPVRRLILMDPLARELSCTCIVGFAQRRYDLLAVRIEDRLGTGYELAIAHDGFDLKQLKPGPLDVIIGPHSVVEHAAKEAGVGVRAVASLTDPEGRTDTRGSFLVRADSSARSLQDLGGKRFLFGPPEVIECHTVAIAALKEHGIEPAAPLEIEEHHSVAVLGVVTGEADVAVLPEFGWRRVVGCGTVPEGALKVIGNTAPVPFTTVWINDRMEREAEVRLLAELEKVGDDPGLLEALESRDGFVPFKAPPDARAQNGWTDFRGPNRNALVNWLPARLPEPIPRLWTAELTGLAIGGIAATERHVLVADKDETAAFDLLRCFDARTGKPDWTLRYPAGGKMDYSNSPRATPVIHGRKVYLLGAFGDLHCVDLGSGVVLWKTNIVEQFDAVVPTWGCCWTPLVVGDSLIVNPGGSKASLAALELNTGRVVWMSPPENAPGYGSLISLEVGGEPQIVGCDADGLGGWDPRSGKRLWKVVDEGQAYRAAGPLALDGRFLLGDETNGTFLYRFDDDGRPRRVAGHEWFNPDTGTPVAVGGRLFGAAAGYFYCLDLEDRLKTVWEIEDHERFGTYCAVIADGRHVLVATFAGELLLLRVDAARFEVVSETRPFGDEEIQSYSHPAVVGRRLLMRSDKELICLDLDVD